VLILVFDETKSSDRRKKVEGSGLVPENAPPVGSFVVGAKNLPCSFPPYIHAFISFFFYRRLISLTDFCNSFLFYE